MIMSSERLEMFQAGKLSEHRTQEHVLKQANFSRLFSSVVGVFNDDTNFF